MDFISWAELGMSVVAVAGVFCAVTGLMVLVATELTEEGRWFLWGTVVPVLLLLPVVILGRPWDWLLGSLAVGMAGVVPWVLVWRRREECLKPILAGQVMLILGVGVVAGLIGVHYEHFVQ